MKPYIMLVMDYGDATNLDFLKDAEGFKLLRHAGPVDNVTFPNGKGALAVYSAGYYEMTRNKVLKSGKPVVLLNANGDKPKGNYLFEVEIPFNRPIDDPEKEAVLTEFEDKVEAFHSQLR